MGGATVALAPEPYIVTPRTFIVATPTEVIERRLQVDDFFADLDLGPAAGDEPSERVASVHFGPEWPGDTIDFERWAAVRKSGGAEGWAATIVDRASLEAIGQMGCLAPPDAGGAVEIRYATTAGMRDRGIATEAGGAFVAWLLAQPNVRGVVAECRVDNAPSVRVIEKLGFALLEEREDEDGRVLRWEKRA